MTLLSNLKIFICRFSYVPFDFRNNREVLPKIGDNIRKYRVLMNLSQSQLAYETGTTLRQIQRIESGEINAGVLYYIKIAEVLEVDIIEIFGS